MGLERSNDGISGVRGSFPEQNSSENSADQGRISPSDTSTHVGRQRHFLKGRRALYLVPLALCVVLGIVLIGMYGGGVLDSDDDGHGGNTLPKFRAINGSGYGTTTHQPMTRLLEPRNFSTWSSAGPDPADLSDSLDMESGSLHDGESRHPNYSSLLWLWGQFIDHTIVLTEPSPEPLYTGRGRVPSNRTDAVFDSDGVRHQINQLTPYIDGSMVYGSENGPAENLRLLNGDGKLRMSANPFFTEGPEKEMLPFDPSNPGHLMAGDKRAEEHVGLTALHTLFVREHNFWCEELKKEHPDWDGDELYHTTRHIVVGEIQSITFESWLPELLGEELPGPGDTAQDCSYGSDGECQAVMFNEFASAGYRFGHAMVNDCLQYRSPTDGSIQGCLHLMEAFFQRNIDEGTLFQLGVGPFLLGGAKQAAKQRTPALVDPMRVLMFSNSSAGTPPLDLAALNLARGRDHELPSYQDLFRLAAGTPLTLCSQISKSESTCSGLESLYGGSLSEIAIDPWIGVLVERNLPHGALGTVASYLLKKQFQLLRDADPYFYTRDSVFRSFEEDVRVKGLRGIIARNTDVPLDLLPANVFRA